MQLIEEKLFGLLLNDDRALLDQLRYGVQLLSDDLSPDAAKLWDTIQELSIDNHPILPGVVSTFGKLPLDALNNLADQGFGVGMSEAVSYARKLVNESDQRRAIAALGSAQSDLLAGKSLLEVQRDIAARLVQPRGNVFQDASLGAIHKRIQKRVDSGEVPLVVRTGIDWVDAKLGGGLKAKRFIAIGGHQKGRKTTFARNVGLGAAKNGASVALMAFENDQEISYFDFVAMEAQRWFIEHHGHADNKVLNGEDVQSAVESGKVKNWSPALQEAIAYAMQTIDALKFYVYDTLPENGNLVNLDNLRMATEKHYRQHVQPGQAFVIIIDYAQLIHDSFRLFEDMVALTAFGLWASQYYGATVIMLSQFNENTNFTAALAKQKGEAKLDHVGTKGGGDLEASVQNYFVVEYDAKTPTTLVVTQQRARRGGFDQKRFTIHPPSGLML